MKKMGYLFVVLAAVLWGTIGIPTGKLQELGLVSYEIGVVRSFFGALLTGSFIMVYDISLFKFKPRYLLLLIAVGAASQAGLNIGYFNAISELGVGVAVVLLYTSPIFANLISYLVYKERLTVKKWLSIFLAITGCFLAVTGGILNINLSTAGVLSGLLAGFSFGITPILTKKLEGRVKVLQILFYSFLSGGIIQLLLVDTGRVLSKMDNSVIYYSIILAVFPTILSFTFYNLGLKYVEPGIASIICVAEVGVATLIARYYFHEPMGMIKVTGVLLIITASVLPNLKGRNKRKRYIFSGK